MENKNKNLILFTLSVITVIVIVATVIKVYKRHRENLYNVLEKRITEKAESCLKDKICTSDKIKLGFLIENGYLKEQIDPITKEYISEDLIIECQNIPCKVKIR